MFPLKKIVGNPKNWAQQWFAAYCRGNIGLENLLKQFFLVWIMQSSCIFLLKCIFLFSCHSLFVLIEMFVLKIKTTEQIERMRETCRVSFYSKLFLSKIIVWWSKFVLLHVFFVLGCWVYTMISLHLHQVAGVLLPDCEFWLIIFHEPWISGLSCIEIGCCA